MNKLIVVKNARLHQYNNGKSINIGETPYITFNFDKIEGETIKKVENWFKSLKKEDIEIFLPGKCIIGY